MKNKNETITATVSLKIPLNEIPVVMIVDDNYNTLKMLKQTISSEIFNPIWFSNVHEAIEWMKNSVNEVHIIIIDMKTCGVSWSGFLYHVKQFAPYSSVLLAGPLGPTLYKKGRFYEYEGHSLKREINTILTGVAQELYEKDAPDGFSESNIKDHYKFICGKSRKINEIYRFVDKLKTGDDNIVIQGEKGTGKKLLARVIHCVGLRREAAFVKINCSKIEHFKIENDNSEKQIKESGCNEQQQQSIFDIACGGTIFLEQIEAIGEDLQKRLLNILKKRENKKPDNDKSSQNSIRIITATNQNLKKNVIERKFCYELYLLLNGVTIDMPALRERKEDIPILLERFLNQYSDLTGLQEPLISNEARKAIYNYNYPGNVQELMDLVEQLFALYAGDEVRSENLPNKIKLKIFEKKENKGVLRELPPGGIRFKDVEKELIIKTIELTGGNKTAAAKLLGITRRRLYLRLSILQSNK